MGALRAPLWVSTVLFQCNGRGPTAKRGSKGAKVYFISSSGTGALLSDLEGQHMSQGGSVYGYQKLQLAQAVLQRLIQGAHPGASPWGEELQHTVGQRQAADGQQGGGVAGESVVSQAQLRHPARQGLRFRASRRPRPARPPRARA